MIDALFVSWDSGRLSTLVRIRPNPNGRPMSTNQEKAKGTPPASRRVLKVVLFVGVLVVLAALFFVRPTLGEVLRLKKAIATLREHEDLSGIAEIMMLQLTERESVSLRSTDEGFPEELRAMGGKRLVGSPERVVVEFGGGFYHYGYRLEAKGDSKFRLTLYGEYPEDDEVLLESVDRPMIPRVDEVEGKR